MPTRVPPDLFAEMERKGMVARVGPGVQLPGDPPAAAPAKGSKFRNQAVEVEGFTFQSKKEAREWLDLREQQRAGLIEDLRRQREFPLEVNGVLVTTYRADFTYRRKGRARLVVVDVKSPPTRKLEAYRIKRKLMRAVYGIVIEER